jgi:hypothetical protein
MDLATCDVDTAFSELVYADAQWLREEFEALIAASFGQPPAAPPPPGSATLAAAAAHSAGHNRPEDCAGTPPPALTSGLTCRTPRGPGRWPADPP